MFIFCICVWVVSEHVKVESILLFFCISLLSISVFVFSIYRRECVASVYEVPICVYTLGINTDFIVSCWKAKLDIP